MNVGAVALLMLVLPLALLLVIYVEMPIARYRASVVESRAKADATMATSPQAV
jgi:hypothetical protein